MEPTLAEKVSVLQRELNLSEGENFVDAVDNALEKIGLADELRGPAVDEKGRCGPSDPRRDTADERADGHPRFKRSSDGAPSNGR